MAIYKAGGFSIDGNTLNTESDYVKKEYDAAKRELEFLSFELSKICSRYGSQFERIIVPFDARKKFLLCYLESQNVYFAQCSKDDITNITKIFSASDTKKNS